MEEALSARGLAHYEISNYARPGHEARHNLGYWRGVDYLGLGCGAFGTVSNDGGTPIPPAALRRGGTGTRPIPRATSRR